MSDINKLSTTETWIPFMDLVNLLGVTKQAISQAIQDRKYLAKKSPGSDLTDNSKTLVALKSLPVEVQNRYLEQHYNNIETYTGITTPPSLQKIPDPTIRSWFRSPDWQRDEAVARMKLVNLARELRQQPGSTKAIESLAAENDISGRTLLRYVKTADQALAGVNGGDQVIAQLAALAPQRGKKRGQCYSFSPEAIAYAVEKYCDQTMLNLLDIYHHLKTEAEIQGWKVGSYNSLRRILDENISQSLTDLTRSGPRKWTAGRSIKILRNYEEIPPNFMWVGDHHIFDVFVKFKGEVYRPWLTAWMDMRTRALMGWVISFQPNSLAIALALRNAILPKNHADFPMQGLPASIYIDNGKDYKSKFLIGEEKSLGSIDYPAFIEKFRAFGIDPFYIDLEYDPKQRSWVKKRGNDYHQVKSIRVGGVFARLGIHSHYATAYHPWAKPIERMFRNVVQDFSRGLPGWCGSNPDEKPEKLAWERKRGLFLEYEDFKERFTDWVINQYHHRPQEGHGMRGMSPNEVWTALVPETPYSVHEAVLDFALMRKDRVKMHSWGLTLNGTKYEPDIPTSIEGAAAWDRVIGEYVRVLYDPWNTRRAKVFFREQYWFDAVPLRYGSFLDDTELKRKAKLQAYQRKFLKEQEKRIQEGSAAIAQIPRSAWYRTDPLKIEDAESEGPRLVELKSESDERPLFLDDEERYRWLLQQRARDIEIDADDQEFMAEFEKTDAYQMTKGLYQFEEEQLKEKLGGKE